MIDYQKETYNKLELLPQIPYKVLERLMTDTKAELIWKLLKYNENDAYSKTNLTLKEKSELIYNGSGDISKYNVFLDPYIDEATVQQKTFLRIYNGNNYPEDHIKSIQEVVFEIYCHPAISTLKNYQDRIDTIIQCIFETLNGADTGQLGHLYYNDSTRANCKILILGTKPYKGKYFVLGTRI